MARVVVTGGAGYIGSHAVRTLVEAGHAVAVLDDLSAGHAASLPAGIPLVKAAIQDRDAVHKLLVDHRADAVMHFAAWLKVGESVEKPLEYYQNNVVGTLAVLAAMRDYDTSALEKKLARLGYHQQVIPDEVHAYLVAPAGSLGRGKALAPLRQALRAIYRQHAVGLPQP